MSKDELKLQCRSCGGHDHYLTEISAGGGIFSSVVLSSEVHRVSGKLIVLIKNENL